MPRQRKRDITGSRPILAASPPRLAPPSVPPLTIFRQDDDDDVAAPMPHGARKYADRAGRRCDKRMPLSTHGHKRLFDGRPAFIKRRRTANEWAGMGVDSRRKRGRQHMPLSRRWRWRKTEMIAAHAKRGADELRRKREYCTGDFRETLMISIYAVSSL